MRGKPDVSALASRRDGRLCVLVWHFHDDDLPGSPAVIELVLDHMAAPDRPLLVQHFRIDREHSNAYEAWRRMGSPSQPTPEQYAQLERASQLTLFTSPEWVRAQGNKLALRFSLPRQAVSLVVVDASPAVE